MRRTVEQRFWEKVDRSAGVDACWPWLGYINPNGYGYFRLGTRVVRAHRVALALSGIALEAGQDVLHECDNKVCCNPYSPAKHLRPGTKSDNLRDAYRRGRRIVKREQEALALKVAG